MTFVTIHYQFDRRKLDGYTWENWSYSDGTKVYVDPVQNTHLFGLSLIQRF